jgi:hypothetical protein
MTITPPRLVRVSVAILLATTVGILAVGCAAKSSAGPSGSPSASSDPTKTTPSNTVPKLDAVTISDAVLFNQGPAAQYLAKLNRPQVTMTDDLTAIRTDIDTKLAADSAFASDFATRMQSGDPAQVQAALTDDATSYIRPALDTQFGADAVDSAVAAFDDELEKHVILDVNLQREFALYNANALSQQTQMVDIDVVGLVTLTILGCLIDAIPGHILTQATLIRDIAIKDITVGLQLGAQIA